MHYYLTWAVRLIIALISVPLIIACLPAFFWKWGVSMTFVYVRAYYYVIFYDWDES